MPDDRYHIFLFDVDGVIVNPVAYRLGITKTLIALCEKIGLQNIDAILPNEAEIAAMEAQGVHDVWDITNIIFCDILTTIALQERAVESSSNFHQENTAEHLRALKELHPTIARPGYLKLAQDIASNEFHSHPPDLALTLFRNKLSKSNHNKDWIDLLVKFLIGTRSAYSSYGTRLFQNIILGSHDFERTYELSSEYPGVGLLRAEDITLIGEKTVEQLMKLNNRQSCAIGVYTARPSLPPKHSDASPVGYSPEAEIALESAGMQSLPLIGMGMMEWLGKQHNERTEDLTKPNTTQALAALINTITCGQDVAALNEAYAIDKQNKKPAQTQLTTIRDKKTTVYVFEDTISGIVPLQKTTQMLRSQGFDLQLEALGIATDPNKRAALEKHCKGVFADVNKAFESISMS
ncbi:MAG: hypothetical protein JST89_23060 [Cyanobacteria bacterium SZAS-4]|nr:hypothetical protein [Cyanobacteria bacterium SZAS-4]